jgi:hypothetical protein
LSESYKKREQGTGNREQGTGNRKRVLGDFTFLHIPLNFSVHLLRLSHLKNIDLMNQEDNQEKSNFVVEKG